MAKKRKIRTTKIQYHLPLNFTLVVGIIANLVIFVYQPDIYLKSTDSWILITMGSCYLVLLLLDMVNLIVFPNHMPIAIDGVMYIARVAIVIFLVVMDPTEISFLLIGLIPYYTYLLSGAIMTVLVVGAIGYLFYLEYESVKINLLPVIGSLMFFVTTAIITKRSVKVTMHNMELMNELGETNIELKVYADEIGKLSVIEERMTLSGNLHDSIGHYLTAISIQLEKALALHDISKEQSNEAILNSKDMASKALNEVRQFVGTLQEQPESFNFIEKAQEVISTYQNDTRMIEFHVNGDEMLYPSIVRRNFFYAIQEALTNIQKHAHASHVDIMINFDKKNAVLMVADDGMGFNLRRARNLDGHYGLANLERRARLLGGEFSVDSKVGRGTTIEIKIPNRSENSKSKKNKKTKDIKEIKVVKDGETNG
jgi:signal transduction histidine kinase